MSRASLLTFTEELGLHIVGQNTNMRRATCPNKKVGCTLYYFIVSVIVRETGRAIAIHLGPKYLKLPVTKPEDLISGFYHVHGMPQCLRAVEGTHREIRQPSCNSMDFVLIGKGNIQ
ncbi:unnamed protein product [Lepeophtheirus salmonis]|uniref:(salmon louse) hypothetical protein n=1 Tax=Lepeophtheirus salmonis TaxID=72036 RepID=A0A7R8CX14_LEPSM|nr:unnamed protein product [Lepeophtheirus salmonis]CAF2927356.1 unnamed protein product [Lepeophtheirus salmonis]